MEQKLDENNIINKNSTSPKINRIYILILLLAIFISPLFIHYSIRESAPDQWKFLLAHSHFGDQAHYMIMLSSIVEDFDLDPTNNYDNALKKGTFSAGKYLRGMNLDHHTILVNKKTGEKYVWSSIFHYLNLQRISPTNQYEPGEEVPFDHQPHFVRNIPPDKLAAIDLSDFKEVPIHPPGLPLFASIFVFPFRFSQYIDTAALTLSVIISIIGLYFLHLTLRKYAPNQAHIVTAAVAFGTPIWLYSKTFFTEPYLAAFLVIAYYFLMVRKIDWAGGIFIGLAFLTKPVCLLVAGIFMLYFLIKKEYRRLLFFIIPVAASAILVLIYNYHMLGTPFGLSQEFVWGNPVVGLFGILFDSSSGFFPFAPVLLLSLFGFSGFMRNYKEDCIILILIILSFVLSGGFWKFWHGMTGYASRLLVPIIPFFAIPLAIFLKENKKAHTLWIFYAPLAVSVLINGLAAFDSIYCWKKPPWAIPMHILSSFIQSGY